MTSPSPHETTTVAVIGLGYVGSTLAAALAGPGVTVVGIDRDPTLVDQLRNGHCRYSEPGVDERLFAALDAGSMSLSTDCAAAATADVVVLTVGTPIGAAGELDDSQLRGACVELARHLRRGQLVVLKSTVPPGTTGELVASLLEGGGLRRCVDFGLTFCPERLSEGTALREMLSYPIVVGGCCPASADAAEAFWRSAIGTEVIRCSSLAAAETVKLADNWWIDHNIAMANELARFCAVTGVDVLEVVRAANSIPKGNGNVNILLPSVGVGGSCLTKDPWMVWRSAGDRGVELRTIPVVRQVNDAMPHYTVELLTEALLKAGKHVETATIAVLGLAFKNNTGDLRATPVAPVVAGLRAAGATVRIVDPLAEPHRIEAMFGMSPTASVAEAVAGADCVAVLARHDAFADLDFAGLAEQVADGCLVFDGRAYYSPEEIARLRDLGFAYCGIGR